MRLRSPAVALLTMCCAWAGAAALASQAPPDSSPTARSAANPAGSEGVQTGGGDAAAIFAAPLLREGSHLLDVKARLVADPEHDWWLVIIETDRTASHPTNAQVQPLIPLPCTRLSEMQRVLESTGSGAMQFLISGAVFVYRDRNYLLPTQAAMLGETAVSAGTQAQPDATNLPAAAPPTSPRDADSAAPPDDSAEAIARRLAEASGPLARSAAPAPAVPASGRDVRAASRAAPGPAENTAIVARRGRLMRDRGGAWLFVLDADAAGLADPPMRLMPCMLLERIEGYAQSNGHNAPALLSGETFLYEGQLYLMPSVFRIPRDVTPLNP